MWYNGPVHKVLGKVVRNHYATAASFIRKKCIRNADTQTMIQ